MTLFTDNNIFLGNGGDLICGDLREHSIFKTTSKKWFYKLYKSKDSDEKCEFNMVRDHWLIHT